MYKLQMPWNPMFEETKNRLPFSQFSKLGILNVVAYWDVLRFLKRTSLRLEAEQLIQWVYCSVA